MKFPLWRRGRKDEVNEEIQGHLRMAARERMERGQTAEQARAAAHRELGNAGLVAETMHEAGGWVWIEGLVQDVRYGIRMLLKSPMFVAATILTLALGIGANTAIFTTINAALLRPLPYRDSGRVVHLWETRPRVDFEQMEFSYPDFRDFQSQNRAFEDLAGYSYSGFVLAGPQGAERLNARKATTNFFPLLGVRPILGRNFRPEEQQAGAGNVVLLTYGFWKRQFNGSADAVGQKLTLTGEAYTIIGVLPADFEFAPAGRVDVWSPMVLSQVQETSRGRYWFHVIGRLKPGVSFEQAREEMNNIASNLGRTYPVTNGGGGVRVIPIRQQIVGPVGAVLLALFGAVGFVLLIACANVANLLLVRATHREKEIAIRTTLGAGRVRIVRQLLAESLLLALAGGALGLVLAVFGADLLVRAIPADLLNYVPFLQHVGLDRSVLLFNAGLVLFTGVAFGLAPALKISRADLQSTLKEGGRTSRGSGHQRLRSVLVASEIALAMVLTVGMGLTVKSLARLLDTNPGFNTHNLLMMQITLPETQYAKDAQVAGFFSELRRRVAALPGVTGAATVSTAPLTGGGGTVWYDVKGRAPVAGGQHPEANMRDVSPNYFQVMQIPLLRGRYPTDADNASSQTIAIINEAFARRTFGDKDPLGQRLILPSAPQHDWEIVGVVGDADSSGLDAHSKPALYFCDLQDTSSDTMLMVRATSDRLQLADAVRQQVRALDADVPVYDVKTMDQAVAQSPGVFLRRYPSILLGLFAGLALVLASIGIYGVMAYAVTQRTHEIGLRMALGAQARDVLRLVLVQGLRITVAGLAVGFGLALAVGRFLGAVLYGVTATDPAILVAVPAALAVTALVACYIPARRAMRVDPMVALRYE